MHRNAPDDAAAAMCAHAQGKFWEFAPAMYDLEASKDGLRVSDDERLALLKKIGGNEAEFTKCVNEGNYINKIAQDMKEGEALGLQGTPSIYLNGKLMEFTSKEGFFKIIDAALQTK